MPAAQTFRLLAGLYFEVVFRGRASVIEFCPTLATGPDAMDWWVVGMIVVAILGVDALWRRWRQRSD